MSEIIVAQAFNFQISDFYMQKINIFLLRQSKKKHDTLFAFPVGNIFR